MEINAVNTQLSGSSYNTAEDSAGKTPDKIKTVDTVGSKVRNVDTKELESALNGAAKTLGDDTTSLKFEVHKATNTIMVKVIDDKTQQVIREIPSEKVLDMVASIWKLVGILMDKKA